MSNNQPTRNFYSIKILVAELLTTVTGPAGWVLSIILSFILNWLAKKGIYFIDVSSAEIKTNMDGDNWVRVMGDGWEKVNPNISEKDGISVDNKVISAFDKFVVFTRVSKRN